MYCLKTGRFPKTTLQQLKNVLNVKKNKYIGESLPNLNKRMIQHKNSIIYNRNNPALSNHIIHSNYTHHINFDDVNIIGREKKNTVKKKIC